MKTVGLVLAQEAISVSFDLVISVKRVIVGSTSAGVDTEPIRSGDGASSQIICSRRHTTRIISISRASRLFTSLGSSSTTMTGHKHTNFRG